MDVKGEGGRQAPNFHTTPISDLDIFLNLTCFVPCFGFYRTENKDSCRTFFDHSKQTEITANVQDRVQSVSVSQIYADV